MSEERSPRDLRLILRPPWEPGSDDRERRGLLSRDPRARTLLRVLVSYPQVRHALPDRISLDAGTDARLLESLGRFVGRQAWLVRSVRIS